MSADHVWFGPVGLKSRSTKSAATLTLAFALRAPSGVDYRAHGINGKQPLPSASGGSSTALDRRRGSIGGGAGRWAAPDGTALGWFGSVHDPKPVGRRDHRRGALVDGVHDLGVVDAAPVHRRDPEVGMPELPLDDHQRDALTRHLDRVCMPELMWRQPATHPGCDRGVAQLDADPGRGARPSASRAAQDTEQRADRQARTKG
jgi:hypothetical protein